jgi:hypothetical protein
VARETQSIAFFRAAVMPLLYSGEAYQQPVVGGEQVLELAAFPGIPRRLQVLVVEWQRKVTQPDERDPGAGPSRAAGGDGHEFLVVGPGTEACRRRRGCRESSCQQTDAAPTKQERAARQQFPDLFLQQSEIPFSNHHSNATGCLIRTLTYHS